MKLFGAMRLRNQRCEDEGRDSVFEADRTDKIFPLDEAEIEGCMSSGGNAVQVSDSRLVGVSRARDPECLARGVIGGSSTEELDCAGLPFQRRNPLPR